MSFLLSISSEGLTHIPILDRWKSILAYLAPPLELLLAPETFETHGPVDDTVCVVLGLRIILSFSSKTLFTFDLNTGLVEVMLEDGLHDEGDGDVDAIESWVFVWCEDKTFSPWWALMVESLSTLLTEFWLERYGMVAWLSDELMLASEK